MTDKNVDAAENKPVLDSQAIDKVMAERFPEWTDWRTIIRGFYFFQQCGTAHIITRMALRNHSDEFVALIEDFIHEYGIEYLQQGTFGERPFSQLKTYVWHMAGMQMMADFNMDGYHFTEMSRKIDNIRSVDNFSLGALLMDFEDLLTKIHEVAEDKKDMASEFQAQVSTQVVMNMQAGYRPSAKIDLEELDESVRGRIADGADAYQVIQAMYDADGKNYDSETIPAFVYTYVSLVDIDSKVSMYEFLARRLMEAGEYIATHTQYFDIDKEKPWDVHALWSMFTEDVRSMTWPSDDTARKRLSAMFRAYAIEQERGKVSSVDDSGAIVEFSGTVHPWHLDNERALERFSELETPASLTRMIYPRQDDGGDVW